jgi:hypothetical protein
MSQVLHAKRIYVAKTTLREMRLHFVLNGNKWIVGIARQGEGREAT